MIEKLLARLVPEARHWWRMWSVWLAALAGVLATVFTSSPATLQWLVNELLPPGPLRTLLSVVVGLTVFVVPVITRLWAQASPAKKEDN